MPLTREQLEAQAPDLVKSILAEGAAAECARINGVKAQSIPGHEKLIEAMMFDGKSSAGDAAMAVLAAESTLRKAHIAANEAPAPVVLTPTDTVQTTSADAESARIAGLPVDERCQAQWEANTGNVRDEFTSLAEFGAFVKASESGKVRILTSRASA